MKKIKSFLFGGLAGIFSVLFALSPTNVSALGKNYNTSNLDYYISSYDVEMKVNEDNSFDIVETIEAHFNVAKHGIFRKIPLYNSVKRTDGTSSKNRAIISDVKVNEKSTSSREGEYLVVKIGDEDKTLTGDKTYQISYNYNIGADPLSDKDELYFNIIGTEWDTVIDGVVFKISMPKDFDEEKLGFSIGRAGVIGTTVEDDVYYYVSSGNEIIGGYSGMLGQYEGINIRLELPEGYFNGKNPEPSSFAYILYIVPVIFAAISIFLWAKHGRDEKVFVNPEYFPPEKKNSLEIGYLYKGSANSTDVISLLIYLANKGYLSISEKEAEKSGLLGKKKDFVLKKVKDYDGADENEKKFLEGLFKSGNEVTSKDLYDKFYKTTNEIIVDYNNNKERKAKIFEPTGKYTVAVIIMMILSCVASTIVPFYDYRDFGEAAIAIIFPMIGYFVIFAVISATAKASSKKTAIFGGAFAALWGIIWLLGAFFAAILPEISLHPVYMIGWGIGFVSILIMTVFAVLMKKRTHYGAEILAKIEGFKDFLTSVEKERLEKMVEENPKYYYEILPYTYVLGISDKWISKFESINLQAPDWYSGSTAFNAVYFSSFMNSTMHSATTSMSASSSSSSSGGGGFSGGGSGGGGGGSW